MPALTVTFDYSQTDQVTVVATGRPGRVDGLNVGPDGAPMFYVRSSDAAGMPAEGWRRRAEIADWAEAPATVISRIQYFQLFTQAEQLAITGSDNPQVRLMLAALSMVDRVDLADATITASLDALVGFGMISADRAAQIKAGQPPEAA